jgi:glycosyltransferase involved in cell wall biosynthesis
LIIFVVSGVDLSYQDGGRTHLLEKWTHAAAEGHAIDLWAFAGQSSPVWSPLAVHTPRHLPVRGLAGPSYSVSLLASVLWHVRRRRPDAIHVRLAQPTVPVALALRRLSKVPVVVEVTGPIAEEARLYGVSERKIALIRSISERAMKAADAVVAVTDGIKQQLVGEYGVAERTVHVVGNGVNTEVFRPRPSAEARTRLGLEARGPIVGFVGNLHRWQGTEFLIEAAPTILSAFPAAEIHVVGDGVTRESLERSATQLGVRDRVRFHGQVPYDDVPDFISACDVLVAPLLAKPTGDSGYSPLKLYEYLSSGRPVVASRLDGLEIVEREGLGRLVPPADADALARAVVELLADDEARAEMADRARRVAMERFGWDRAAERTIEILQEVARPR